MPCLPRQKTLVNFITGKIEAQKSLMRKMLALIVLGALLIPLTSLSVHSKNLANSKSTGGSEAVPTSPVGPVAPLITATKTDALLVDNDNDNTADTGDTLKYTVTITNNGTDATGVNFNDTLDANTTLVPGSITSTPVAVNDTYAASGNIQISINAASGVLANDNDADGNTLTASAGALSTNGGNVTMNANGSFTYNPPAGFEGADSFTYSITDGITPDTATVTINVSGMIWFIDNTAAPGGDGRLTSPFNALTGAGSFDAVAADGPGDNIFLYTGSGDYNGGLTLLASQKLIGQGAGNTLSAISGVTPPSGSLALPATGGASPNIVSSANGINLGSNNLIRGLDIGNTSGTDIAGSSFGVLTVREVNLSGTGQALSLGTGMLDAIFGSVASTNSGSTGASLTTVSGTLISGPTTIQNPSGVGIDVSTSDASLNFGDTSVVGSGNTGVNLQSNTGNISFGALSITADAGQRGLLANLNSTGTIASTSGAISASGVPAVEVNGTSAGTRTNLNMTLTSVSATGGTSGLVLVNTNGNFGVTGDGTNVANGSGGTIQGMLLDGVVLNTVTNVSLTGVNIQSNLNNGILGTNVNGFVLDDANVSNNTNATGESNVRFTNLTGTLVAGTNPTRIEDTTIGDSFEHNVVIINTLGTLPDLLIKNSLIRDTGAPLGADGVNIETQSSAIATVRVEGSTFQGNGTQGFQGTANGSSSLTVNATSSNVFQNNNEGIVLSLSTNSDLTFDISNNSFTGQPGTAIFVGTASTATASADLRGKIIGNNVNMPVSGVNHSVTVFPSGNSLAVVKVDGNTIVNNGPLRALNVTQTDVNANTVRLDITVTNNNVTSATGDAIYVEGRRNGILCAKIENNTATSPVSAIILRRLQTSTVSLEQGSSVAVTPTQVLIDNNPATAPASISTTGTPITLVANGACNMVARLFPDEAPNKLARSSETAKVRAPNSSTTKSATTAEPTAKTFKTREAKGRSSALMNHAVKRSPTISASSSMVSTINLNIGTLPAGKSVTITFQAMINNSVPPGTTQVSNQGIVSGDNFADVLTDDPDVGGAADPTVTPIQAEAAPEISCPSPITVVADSGSCSKSVSFSVTASGSPTPTVDCKIGATSITSPHTFPVGTTTVVCTASNGVPPDDSCSFTVTVTDPDAPVITVNGPNPMTVECHTTFTDPGATANDLCAGSVPVTTTGTVDPDVPGTYTITYSATDGTNTATATRTVNVVDTSAPIITVNGANPMTVECHTSFSDPGATAVDACAGSVPVTATGTVNVNVPGTYTITYSATDGTNSATATRTVNVVDTTAPVITVNGANPMTVECHTTFTDPGATASDSCSGSVPVTTTGTVNANVPGTYTITYSATDGTNTATATRTVNVTDTIAPVITVNGPNPMTVECHTSFSDPGATANDSCAGAVPVTTSGSVNVNVPGTYTITYSATDGYNTATTTRTVNVVDTIAPVITINGPNPMTVECHTSFTDPGATATDSCAGNLPVSATSNVNPNVPGTYTVVYSATDGYNSSSATRTVIVVDTIPPTISCQADILVQFDPAAGGAVVTYTPPVGSDSCAGTLIATQTTGLPSGATFPLGTTINTFQVNDGAGHSATCSFKVVVALTSIIGLDSVTLSGVGFVDSYDSNGSYPATKSSLANVLSNGTITMTNSAKVWGNVRSTRVGVNMSGATQVTGNATAGTTVSLSGSASVGGTITNNALAPVMVLPSVSVCGPPYSSGSGISGSYSYNSGTGDLSLSGTNIATLANGNYCFHNVTLGNSAQLKVNGPVTIKLTGTFNVSGAAIINNTTLIPSNLRILSSYTGSSGVNFTNSASAYLIVYAPRTNVTISGAAPLFGTVMGKTLTVSNSGALHYDVRLVNIWSTLWPLIGP